MQQHPSTQQLELYQRRALAPDLFLSIDRHVSACPMCFENCNAPGSTENDYQTLLAGLMPDPDEAAYHLTNAEMSRYVKKNLDEVSTEIVESHLEVCAECVRAVEALRVTPYDASFVFAAETAGGKEESSIRSNGVGSGAFFAAMTATRRPAQIALIALLALGIVLLAIAFMRTRREQPAQVLTGHDEDSNLNTENRNIVPNSTPDQLRQTDKSADGIDSVQTPSSSEKEQPRPDTKGVSHGFDNEGRGVDGLSPSSQQAVMSALATQRLERPQVLAELNGKSSTLLSESDDGLPFHLLSPVGKVVQNSKPTFHWGPLSQASRYVVTIVDDKLNEVVTSGPLTKTQWSATVPLKRGGTYSWQVTAIKDGQEIVSPVMPAPEAKFKILDQAYLEELKRVKRSSPNYHLGLGVLYTRAGLLDEAEREFQAQVKATPRSEVARKLLDSLLSMKK